MEVLLIELMEFLLKVDMRNEGNNGDLFFIFEES